MDTPAIIQRLIDKGLSISDHAAAQRAIDFIGYFRVRGYGLRFTEPAPPGVSWGTRSYRPGTTLDQILRLYNFDCELRGALLGALQRVEVAARSVLSSYLSRSHGPHWYLDLSETSSVVSTRSRDWLRDITVATTRAKEPFLDHYFRTYTEPALPPFWTLTECLSFGQWSRLYKDLKRGSSAIADAFGLSAPVFGSWLHSLSVLRNICAHHGRLIDRNLPHPPQKHPHFVKHFVHTHRLYPRLVAIQTLLAKIESGGGFYPQLAAIMASSPIPAEDLGFIPGWSDLAPWI
ncbi:MAG: Abi family protein [Nannocystis sp.]|nr:Abi family protein [Nannocystis sp.]